MLLIKENFNLSGFTTMGVDANTRYFAKVTSISDLKEALDFSAKNEIDYLILGGGSNILFVKDFDGLVILNKMEGIEIDSETSKEVLLKISGGENWHQLVLYCIEKGWGGIENLSLIPGTVGASPIQNIGAYGVELKDVFNSLEAYDIEAKKVKNFSSMDCKFGYRDSIFKKELKGKIIITSVSIKLKKNPTLNTSYSSLSDKLKEWGIEKPTIKDVSNAVIDVRQSKLPDPGKIGNTGSFFKNPVITLSEFEKLKRNYPKLPGYKVSDYEIKVPAGWLIEKAGWKGKRFGDAGVHDKQALVLVNHGTAKGQEIWNLAQEIISSIHEKFGISLIPEVNILG